MSDILKLLAENTRLKAEVDNLRKNADISPSQSPHEIERLKAEVERLTEANDCLDKMHEKEMARSAYLCEEVNRTTAWGRGLESDLSHARVEISFLKAEVERLDHQVRYWRIEAECDHGRWLRCLEDLEKLRSKPSA